LLDCLIIEKNSGSSLALMSSYCAGAHLAFFKFYAS
jgi:hypothetical protein